MELIRPPITTVASSALMMPPSPPAKAASGNNAKLVVNAVMRIGRSRTRPPAISASVTDIPRSRNCSTKAINTMALVTTMPISSSSPIMAGSPRERPVMASATVTPINARGRLVMMMNGFRNEPRLPTITRYIRIIPMAIDRNMA